MASFTYTFWTNLSVPALIDRLQVVFHGLNFSLINPKSGNINLWNGFGDEINVKTIKSIFEIELPIGIQWWRGDDDVYVSIRKSKNPEGFLCYVTIVGLSREEQAELAKLLILYVLPGKQDFPDDFYVFGLSVQ